MKAGCRVIDAREYTRFLSELIIHDDASKLRAILRAIPIWEEVAVAEIRATESADTSQMTPEQQNWHAEQVNDQFYMIDAVKNSLYAGLAVAVAATVEGFMGRYCAENAVELSAGATWRHKRTGVEGLIGVQLDVLSGFGSANRARLLSNCFKHNGCKTDKEWVKVYSGPLDEEIRYENENWDVIIGDVETFLLEIVKRLPPG
jgi:hypothetical protein